MSEITTAYTSFKSKNQTYDYKIFFCETVGQTPPFLICSPGDIFMSGDFGGSPSHLKVFVMSEAGVWAEWSKEARCDHPIYQGVTLAPTHSSRQGLRDYPNHWGWKDKASLKKYLQRSEYFIRMRIDVADGLMIRRRIGSVYATAQRRSNFARRFVISRPCTGNTRTITIHCIAQYSYVYPFCQHEYS